MQIIDISPEISEETAVYPGDKAFSREVAMAFEKGDHLDLSSIATTVHIGAHTDAPSHYHSDGETMEARPLELYFGECQVIRVEGLGKGRIMPEHIEGLEIKAERVLFATNSFPSPNHWQDDFTSLSPKLVGYLAQNGVRLIGIDTPSVDPSDSKSLESHNAIYKNDMAILEGVVLQDVEEGLYTLSALPLKIKNADASPVRAVLFKN